MKERFEATEWNSLMALPFHLFTAIAMADGEIQTEEMEEFGDRLTRGAFGYKDPLHRELARSIVEADVSDFASGKIGGTSLDPEATKRMLKEKLTSDEYQKFVGSLFIDTVNIAAASETGSFFRKEKICKEERERLTALALFWEVDIGRLGDLMAT